MYSYRCDYELMYILLPVAATYKVKYNHNDTKTEYRNFVYFPKSAFHNDPNSLY